MLPAVHREPEFPGGALPAAPQGPPATPICLQPGKGACAGRRKSLLAQRETTAIPGEFSVVGENDSSYDRWGHLSLVAHNVLGQQRV